MNKFKVSTISLIISLFHILKQKFVNCSSVQLRFKFIYYLIVIDR